MAALLLLARSVLIGLGVVGGGVAAEQALPALGIGGGAPFGLDFGGGRPRRRRRRRALTASDKADIAFISGTLGKPAGRDFAMVVAARS